MRESDVEDWFRGVPPRTLLLAMGATIVLTLLAGHLYVVKPSLVRLRSLDAEGGQASVEALRSDASARSVAIEASRAQLEEISGELYGGPSDQPAEKVESYIVDRLDSLSVRHAVELVSVEPGEAQSVLMFDEWLYEVEVEGEFLALAAWLGEIENELRPMVVNGFELRPAQQTPWVRMRLRLASYRPRRELS